MKTLKTLTVALTVAASLAFCATSAKADVGTTTNYDTVTFSATLMTNSYAEVKVGTNEETTLVMKSQKFVTKDLLNLLTNADFANESFPVGAKLELGWDWNGDVLVVDKTGSNVIYDATYNYGNSNIATVVINPWNQTGAVSIKQSENGASFVWYNSGSFQLKDANANINITGMGPSTEHFSVKFTASAETWTDSQNFGVYGANESSGISPLTGTLTGSITLSGKGPGEPMYIIDELMEHVAP